MVPRREEETKYGLNSGCRWKGDTVTQENAETMVGSHGEDRSASRKRLKTRFEDSDRHSWQSKV